MKLINKYEVPAEKLRWSCNPEDFPFDCTDQIRPLEGIIGQDRALEAIRFALEVDKPGYNLFVTGLTGTGRTTAIKAHIQRIIEARKNGGAKFDVYDWCYLYNFADPDRPRALRLTRGNGRPFRQRVQDLLASLRNAVPKLFSTEEYQSQRKRIEEEGRLRHGQMLDALQRKVRQENFGLQFSPMGVNLFALREGRALTTEEFTALPPDQQGALENKREQLAEQVQTTLEQLRALEQETFSRMHGLDRAMAENGLDFLFKEVLHDLDDQPAVEPYLKDLKEYTLNNLDLFRGAEPPAPATVPAPGVQPPGAAQRSPFLPYEVALMVDNSGIDTAPIIIESHPTWGNLFGRIERRALLGTYLSDHTMLKAGSLHQANGGYLILNVREVLLGPGVWESLKRVLRDKEVRPEDPSEQFGFMAPQALRPQPIPLDLKVIVTGDEATYAILSTYDQEDFWQLFKVKAEFDFQVELTEENIKSYCHFICGICESVGLLHFERDGVGQVLEYAARLVADQQKLSTRFGRIKDLLIEGDYWARKDHAPRVNGDHVRRALQEKIYRHNLVEERIRRLITEGTLMVDVEGEVVGQVNGLVVYDLGDFSFGRPARITAKTFAGRRGVVNIEREAQLSGRIHNKGVMIISGFLGWKYAQDKPLSLSASLCFEQSYEGVEGDSASSTELYAILSSLSGIPLRQDIAVTGSVNQKGEIQPIGGVNQKIEGFFDLCKIKGLSGRQGVIVPFLNLRNLMLRRDVVEAVQQGVFHIHAVKTIAEGLEVLSGVPAGEPAANGSYPEETVNYLVDRRLRELAQSLRGFYEAPVGELVS